MAVSLGPAKVELSAPVHSVMPSPVPDRSEVCWVLPPQLFPGHELWEFGSHRFGATSRKLHADARSAPQANAVADA